MQTNYRRLIGLFVWVAFLIALMTGPIQLGWNLTKSAASIHPLLKNDLTLTIQDLAGLTRVNAPVFMETETGWKQQGIVIETIPAEKPNEKMCSIRLYGSKMTHSEHDFIVYQNSGQLSEVIATMLPLHKRQQIANRISQIVEQHGRAFVQDMIPIVQQTLSGAVPEIERGLHESISRHQEEIDELLERWNNKYVEPELIPLAKQELLPIVQTHAQPVAESIGRELWDRASLWRFGWRAAYDKVPLPKKNLVQQEWDRFVQDDAIPVLENHTDEMVSAIQKTLAEITSSQIIREEVANGLTQLANDQETRALIQTLIRESIMENEPLRQNIQRVWTSKLAQEIIAKNSERLEPVVRQIGEDLFGSETEGINPDFARVLRNQILGKDRLWIVAIPRTDESQPQIRPARQWMPYPLIHMTESSQSGGEQW
ncbi:MAG: hypothetical protein L7U72_16395 [Rubripirellula sp.]|nr:hypothetical protein [Rubripirellula sp.]